MELVTLHIGFMLFSVGMIFLADKQAFSWLLGSKETLDIRLLRRYHYLMWAGLLALITTGVIMALPMYQYLLTQPLFIIKMLFVGILMVNAVLVGRLMHIATTRSFKSLSWSERMPLFVSGTVSAFSWSFAIALAYYIFS